MEPTQIRAESDSAQVSEQREAAALALTRRELLRQHAELRDMIADVRAVAARAANGAAGREELQAAVIRLAGALVRHNLFEEEWLRSMDSKVDGPMRAEVDVLFEAHVREHQELHAAVVGIPQMPVKFAGVDVAVLLNGVLEHMADEEASILLEDPPRRA